MEMKSLKRISISNLILIILNEENNSKLRRFAEIELKKRIKHLGWHYDDLLHFDDKVIQQRGLDMDNYLISPNVNMQQLMETYFMYNWQTDYDTNMLLFSEKHLCNEANFGSPFFSIICAKEIENIARRLEFIDDESDKEALLSFKQLLEDRKIRSRHDKLDIFNDDPIELFCYNEAMEQLDEDVFCELLANASDEEIYKLLSSRLGILKVGLCNVLNDTLLDPDLVQYLCGLSFVKRDSFKLYLQKARLMNQVMNGYNVNYTNEQMKKVLQRVKK